MEEKCGQCHYFNSKDGICRNKQMQKECFQGDKDNIYVSREEQKCALFKAKKRKTMTDNEKKANEIAVSIMSKGHIDKNGMCQRRDLERAAMEMAKYKDAQHRTPFDDTTEDFVYNVIGEICCNETDLQRKIEQGKAFAEHNKTVFEVAMAVAASYQVYAESQRCVIKELGKVNDKLRFSLSERETEIERIKDEHKKEMDEYRAVYFRQNKILVEQNNALKRQLSELQTAVRDWGKTEDILNG